MVDDRNILVGKVHTTVNIKHVNEGAVSKEGTTIVQPHTLSSP